MSYTDFHRKRPTGQVSISHQGELLSAGHFVNQVAERARIEQERAPIIQRIINPPHPWDRFAALREFYQTVNLDEYDPYPFNWGTVFTPIERAVWHDLRSRGMEFWPQFPVGKFFIDFADPNKMIGIECDGKEWHDLERDARRDADLRRLGWQIFRTPGAACLRAIEPDWEALDFSEDHARCSLEVERWLMTTSEGLVRCLQTLFYGAPPCRYSTVETARLIASSRLLAGELSVPHGVDHE